MMSAAASFKRLKRNLRWRFFRDIPAFVIVLEKDDERRLHIRRNVLPKLPNCDIVSATNASKADIEDFLGKEGIVVHENYSRVTLAKLACTISHIRAWKAIVAADLMYAIVLEDDVAIRDGFRPFIRKLQKQLPINFDLAHLYVHHDRSEWLLHTADTERAYVSYIPTWGRSAYLLSRTGAKKLLSDFRTITKHGDRQISDMARRGKLLVYCAAESYVDNLGQITPQYNGERFRSNIWPAEKRN
jgi:GR25 family glycosyltransferase involved in LPS biosynthesis